MKAGNEGCAVGSANLERLLPLAEPALVGRERDYVLDCLDSGWISGGGTYVERFEYAFAEFCGVEHGVSCCNGTAAMHLALAALGVGPGDEVIVPTLTYIAAVNPIAYCGATPVFVDSEPRSWNLDPARLEELVTPRTKAIVVVHLYGHPVDMDPVLELARRHGLFVVEDAAEAHGAEYRGRRVGSLGDVAAFSFYGNKTVTTGEGGMVVTQDERLADAMRQLRGQGQDPQRRYWHVTTGFNYRITNISAAIGLAQTERIDWHVRRRRDLAGWYRAELGGIPGLTRSPQLPWARSSFWLSSVLLESGDEARRDEVMRRLRKRGIDSRPFFPPAHTMPMYRRDESFPVAESLSARGMNLPSSPLMSRDDVLRVCAALAEAIE